MDDAFLARRERRLARVQAGFATALAHHRARVAAAPPGSPAAAGTFQVLALSGGGQWGAFGAGFLKGWSARPEAPARPEFQVVTGTSTGALIATFAFLGSAYDDAIGDAYLSIRDDEDVCSRRFGPLLLRADSVATREQFRDRLEGVITPAVVAAVAAEAQRGRRLLVGSTDLLAGEFHAFDLTGIAAGAAAGAAAARRAYVDALMASTAIPVEFPLVTITGADPDEPGATQTFVDGGIRRNIFAEAFARALGAEAEPRPDAALYCLVNGPRDVDPLPRLPGWLPVLAIAQRSVEILLAESTEGNLFRIYLQAQRLGFRFHVAAVPGETARACRGKAAKPDALFDGPMMQALYAAGSELALGPQPWQADPLAGSA